MEEVRRTPSVYKVKLEYSNYEELLRTYDEEILRETTMRKVESFIVDYISRTVEPVGWTAVWRSQNGLLLDSDFIVEVKDVSLQRLEAEVKLIDIIYCTTEGNDDLKTKLYLENMLKQESAIVPLIELHPISEGDEDEQFLKTAIAIEHVRFFYKYLWRPWDDDEEDDCRFVDKYLETRLKFIFDITNKVVTENIIEQASEILHKSWKIKQKLEQLYNNMNGSNSESEINEDDVVESLQLRIKLEELQQTMEILENPVMRTLVIKKDIPQKLSWRHSSGKQSQNSPIIRIVSEVFTAKLLQDLPIDPTAVLEFHHSVASAVASSSSGDHIFILPGHYKCKGLGWLDESITIEGSGKLGNVILEGIDNGSIFINSAAAIVNLCNLVIKSRDEIQSSIVIHSGHLKLTDCLIEGSSSKTCLTVLNRAQATITNSTLHNSKENGMRMSCGTTLIINQSTISDCACNGIKIDGDEATESACTVLSLNNTTIRKNGCYGIIICSLIANAPPENQDNEDYLSLLQSITWLKTSIEETQIIENTLGAVGLHSSNIQPLFELFVHDQMKHSSPNVISTLAWPLDSSGESVFD